MADPRPVPSAPPRRPYRPPPRLGWAPGAFVAWSALGFAVALTLGVVFGILLALVAVQWQPLQDADQAVIDVVNNAVSRNGLVVGIARVLTHLGSPLGVGLVVAVATVWLMIRHLPRAAMFMAVTGLGAAVLGPGIKGLVERARPVVDVPLSETGGASFPSGHAIAVTIAWGALLLVFLPALPARRYPRMLAVSAVIALVATVGLTRIVLGVHYLSDVAGGVLVGVLWLVLTSAAFRTAREQTGASLHPSGLDEVAPDERQALQPVPEGDRPLPRGWTTAAQLIVTAVLVTGAVIVTGVLIVGELATVRRADAQIVGWFAERRTEALTDVAVAVGWLGGVAGIITVLAAAIPLSLALTRRWRPAVLLLVGAAGQGLVYLAASRLVDRPRPSINHVGDVIGVTVSFPSGHVGAAVATYGALGLLVGTGLRHRARWVILTLAVALPVGVALSRVYRGVHYPTDVLVGLLYGAVWLAACWRLLRPARSGPAELPPVRAAG